MKVLNHREEICISHLVTVLFCLSVFEQDCQAGSSFDAEHDVLAGSNGCCNTDLEACKHNLSAAAEIGCNMRGVCS